MNVSEKLSSAVNAWLTSGGDPKAEKGVLKLLDDPKVKALPYRDRNASFITSHKLMKLDYDPYLCWLECVQRIEPPITEENDNFLIGQATDDIATYGITYFDSRYVAVPRRDKKAEESNPGKTLLTNGQLEMVKNAYKEFQTRHFFPPQMNKTNIICIAYGLPVKIELDGLDEKNHVLRDLKTTANLNSFIEDFKPGKRFYDQYLFQFGTYAFIYELKTGEHPDFELLVTDKHDGFSRSHKWVIRYQTLREQFPKVEKLLQDYRNYQESGIWPFLLNLSNLDDLRKFNDSVYYSHPALDQFKRSIPATIL